MTKNRWIFYTFFIVFHVSAFIFTVALEKNTSLLFSLVNKVPWFKWITLLGVILLVTDIVWSIIANKEQEKEKSALNHELNTLKAKLFDLQETARNSSNRPQPPTV